MSASREGCCANQRKPCAYHEGWQDAVDSLEAELAAARAENERLRDVLRASDLDHDEAVANYLRLSAERDAALGDVETLTAALAACAHELDVLDGRGFAQVRPDVREQARALLAGLGTQRCETCGGIGMVVPTPVSEWRDGGVADEEEAQPCPDCATEGEGT